MKEFVKTVVGGMIGIAALYVVGKIAFQAGRDVGEMECRYRAMEKKVRASVQKDENKEEEAEETTTADEPEAEEDDVLEEKPKKQGLFGMAWGIRRMTKKKDSVLGNLIHHPETHRIEAFVQGEELHVNVKPRTA